MNSELGYKFCFDPINDKNLSDQVAQQSKRVVDVVLGAKLLEGFTSELRTIIEYNDFWNTKATKHIFPYEFDKVV